MKLSIEMGENELKKLVFEHLQDKLGEIDLTPQNVRIEVKSKQNYKSEWEEAAFRVRLEVNT